MQVIGRRGNAESVPVLYSSRTVFASSVMTHGFGRIGGITGDEVMTFAPDPQFLLLNGGRPIVSRRVNYLTDALFQRCYDQNTFSVAANERTARAR